MEDNKEIHINWKHENTRYSFLMMLDEEIIYLFDNYKFVV